MPRCTRRLEIDAGHRVTRHESKCRNVHGHRYVFLVTVEAPDLDDAGRVVDFGVIKELVGTWLDENLDHGYIMAPWDEVGIELREVAGLKVFTMPENLGEPTAENLARLVGEVANTLLPDPVKAVKVVCWETPNCCAEWVC